MTTVNNRYLRELNNNVNIAINYKDEDELIQSIVNIVRDMTKWSRKQAYQILEREQKYGFGVQFANNISLTEKPLGDDRENSIFAKKREDSILTNEEYEREADKIAEERDGISDRDRILDKYRVKPLYAKRHVQQNDANTQFASDIDSLGSGKPLSESEREFFELRMNADFSNVRIHDDEKAHELADELNARAFTVGKDIAFGEGEYSPSTDECKRLMAHELTHVMQQNKNIQEKIYLQSKNSEVEENVAQGIQKENKVSDIEHKEIPRKGITLADHLYNLYKGLLQYGEKQTLADTTLVLLAKKNNMTVNNFYKAYYDAQKKGMSLSLAVSLEEIIKSGGLKQKKIDIELRYTISTGILQVITSKGSYNIQATSGKGEHINNPDSVYIKDKGPIPPGIYYLYPSAISNLDFPHTFYLWISKQGDWGDWNVPLQPDAKTYLGPEVFDKKSGIAPRRGFFLHGGRFEGSAGCIDIGGGFSGNETTAKLLHDIVSSKKSKIVLRVELK